MVASRSDGENVKRDETLVLSTGELFPLPFNIQLQNMCPVDILAKKFPVVLPEYSAPVLPNVSLKIAKVQVDEKNLLAQVLLSTDVRFLTEPRLFEISFSILGLFTYNSNYTTDQVRFYLKRGAFGILLPFVRELLASLCARLQVPVVYLPKYSIASSLPEEA